jgi:hypothetical protein
MRLAAFISERPIQGLPLAMLVAEVAVGFHAERITLLMPKEAGHCRNISAYFDAARGNQMSQW